MPKMLGGIFLNDKLLLAGLKLLILETMIEEVDGS